MKRAEGEGGVEGILRLKRLWGGGFKHIFKSILQPLYFPKLKRFHLNKNGLNSRLMGVLEGGGE